MLKLPYNIYFRMPEALRTFNFLDIKRANELFEYRFNTDEIIRRSDGKKMKNVPLYNYLQIKFATIWSNLSCFQDGQKFKKWGEQASNAYYFLIYYILNQLQKKGYVDYEEVIIDLLKDERTKKLFDIYIALLLDDEECTQIDKLKLKEIKEFFGVLENFYLMQKDSPFLLNKIRRFLFPNAEAYSGYYETTEGKECGTI